MKAEVDLASSSRAKYKTNTVASMSHVFTNYLFSSYIWIVEQGTLLFTAEPSAYFSKCRTRRNLKGLWGHLKLLRRAHL